VNYQSRRGGKLSYHKNARLTFQRRVELVRRALVPNANQSALGREFGVSRQTVRKWCARFEQEGLDGLRDRSSRPHRSPRALPRHQRRQIERRRRRRWSSVRIAQYYGFSLSTVVTTQRCLGLNRLSRLEPPRPIYRYEHARPGALLHLDIKKLGKIGRVGHRIHGDRRSVCGSAARRRRAHRRCLPNAGPPMVSCPRDPGPCAPHG
jgi:transposase-like protein